MRKTLLRLVLVCAAIAVTVLKLHAQTTTVQGRVFDAYTGEALPYVNVVLGSGSNGTMTDADGRYAISTEDRPGRLTVTFLGYTGQSFSVVRGIAQQINVSLEPKAFDLGAAEVRPDRKEKNPPSR